MLFRCTCTTCGASCKTPPPARKFIPCAEWAICSPRRKDEFRPISLVASAPRGAPCGVVCRRRGDRGRGFSLSSLRHGGIVERTRTPPARRGSRGGHGRPQGGRAPPLPAPAACVRVC